MGGGTGGGRLRGRCGCIRRLRCAERRQPELPAWKDEIWVGKRLAVRLLLASVEPEDVAPAITIAEIVRGDLPQRVTVHDVVDARCGDGRSVRGRCVRGADRFF